MTDDIVRCIPDEDEEGMTLAHNNNCDGSWCQVSVGEVRLLPYGGDGNLILCHACYAHEIAWRKRRNRELGTAMQFDLPDWKDLKVYGDEHGKTDQRTG